MNPLRIHRVLKKTTSVSQTDREADRKTVLEICSARQIPILPKKKHAQSPPSPPKKSIPEIKTLPVLGYSSTVPDSAIAPVCVLPPGAASLLTFVPRNRANRSEGADQINHDAEMF